MNHIEAEWVRPLLHICPVESGLRLVDNECEHGRLPGDRSPGCGCFDEARIEAVRREHVQRERRALESVRVKVRRRERRKWHDVGMRVPLLVDPDAPLMLTEATSTAPTDYERPRRWRRPDKAGSLYTDEQIRELHVAHAAGESLNALAKRTHEAAGYKNPGSALTALSREFKRRDLRVRERVAATVRAHTKHGLAPKHGPRRGYIPYKRRNGIGTQGAEGYRPICKATRTQYPRKGAPCDRPAMHDSDFCHVHDPVHAAANAENLARARERLPRGGTPMPLAPFSAWLRRRHDELGSWQAVADEIGRTLHTARAYALGYNGRRTIETIGRDTVTALLARAGVAYDDVYQRPAVEV